MLGKIISLKEIVLKVNVLTEPLIRKGQDRVSTYGSASLCRQHTQNINAGP